MHKIYKHITQKLNKNVIFDNTFNKEHLNKQINVPEIKLLTRNIKLNLRQWQNLVEQSDAMKKSIIIETSTTAQVEQTESELESKEQLKLQKITSREKYEIYKQLIMKSAIKLWQIPQRYRNAEICMIAIRNIPNAIRWIPRKILTLEMCQTVVQKNGLLLKYIPMIYRIYSICLTAVTNCSKAFKFVPIPLRKMQEISLITMSNCLSNIKYLPEPYKTNCICSDVVNYDGLLLAYVPLKKINFKICLDAYKNNNLAADFMPNIMKKIMP